MSTSLSTHSRRLAVLLIGQNSEKDGSGLMTIGKSEPAFSHQAEMDHYCELLSAANIRFEIIGEDDITEDTFANKDLVKYVAAIVTVPFSIFSHESFRLVYEASRDFGISIISSFNHVDERSKDMFGIRSLGRKRPLWPLRIKILNWPRPACQEPLIVDYGLLTGVPGIRRRGLKKLAWKQTGKKILKIVRSLYFPYFKVELRPEAGVIATDMKSNPLVWSNKFGQAINYYFAMHGGLFLDKFNEMHRLVRSLIEANSGFGMASMNLENVMALRLDDPGACYADYLDNGGILIKKDWENLGNILKAQRIPLSVVYTPGWVDDGDKRFGRLILDGKEVFDRPAGSLYCSARVRYLPTASQYGVYDHSSEYEGLRMLVEQRLAEVHSHGLTHLDSDRSGWASAKDRHQDSRWYNEFYHVKRGKPVDKEEQSQALSISRDEIFNYFGSLPLAFTPSGHKHGRDTDLLCSNTGYLMFSADYTGILKRDLAVRNWKIRSLFLCLKNPTTFAARSGYPFIGVVHDYEIKTGLDKFNEIIEKWRAIGVKRFASINDLVASLSSSIDAYYDIGASSFNLNLYLPTRSTDNSPFSELFGREMCLRINFPDKVIPIYNKTIISGGTLLSSDTDVQNGIMTILIRSSESPVIRVQVPLIKCQ